MDSEIVAEFLQDSEVVLFEVKNYLEQFSELNEETSFEEFGKMIDKVMSGAFTLSFHDIGELARMGKELSDKSAHISDPHKLMVIHNLISQVYGKISQGIALAKSGKRLDEDEVKKLFHKLQLASSKLGDFKTTTDK